MNGVDKIVDETHCWLLMLTFPMVFSAEKIYEKIVEEEED